MKRTIPIATLILLLAAGRTMAAEETNSPAAPPPPPTTNRPGRVDLSSFQSIAQHNIFDPNRRGYRPPVSREIPVRIDSFALRGTADDDGQKIAVFVGSNSQYSKVATTADTIAGYKIAEIGFDHVKLAAAGNQTVNLPVGSQMKRRDNGPWSLEANAEPLADASPAPATEEKPATGAASASNVESDVIKRLMKKHEADN